MQCQLDPTDQTQENDQKPPFWHFGSFKNALLWHLNDPSWLSNAGKHLVLLHYAISSRSNRPKSRKRPKTCFLALWIIQKCTFVTFEWSNMSHISAKLLRPFSVIKICNIKLIWRTKLDKMADNWMDHSKRPTRRRKKNLKICSRFFPDMRFSRGVQKKSEFSFQTIKS